MTRRHVQSGAPWEATVGYSRAVRVGNTIRVSGTAPVWPDGSCPDDARVQADRCFIIALQAVQKLGGRVDDVVRTRMYLIDRADEAAVGAAHAANVGRARPASTMLVVAGLLDPRWRVEIEMEAELEA